MGLEFLISA
jgi:hypothetical protein